MIILKPGEDSQSLRFIDRHSSGSIISLRDDQTNQVTNIDVTGEITEFSNYRQIDRVFTLLEGHTYDFIVYNTTAIGDVLTAPISFRGIIYCTAQDNSLNQSFKYAESNVTEHTTDNKYTIYE